MNQELPSLKTWLFCQVEREDSVGNLSRAFLERPREFDDWIKEVEETAELMAALDQARVEYEISIESLRSGKYSETFPFALTLPGMEEVSEGSRKFHSEHPGISARAYLDVLREISYEQFIDRRKIVYLDTNFWIGLRKVYMSDESATAEFKDLFAVLTALKEVGAILCPLSFPLLVELFKQNDRTTRTATAELIEHFSDEISLRHPSELLNYEVTKFVISETGLSASHFHRWTKCGFAAGELLPESQAFNETENTLAQKLYIDPVWHVPFSAQIRSLPLDRIISGEQELVRLLNCSFSALKNAELERKQLRDEGVIFAFQTWGLVDLIRKFASDMITEYPAEVAIAMEKRQLRTPSVDPHLIAPAQIIGGINAVYVKSGKKCLTANDVIDSLHAAFALPYCDVFAGDSGLCHTLTEKVNCFDKVYSVDVFSKVSDLVCYLRSLS